MLDHKIRHGHFAAQGEEHPVQVVAINDRLAAFRAAFDREFVVHQNVEIAVLRPVVTGGGIVSVYVPDCKTIVSDDLGLASANWMADRNEMCPEESFGLTVGFTATVSKNVLTFSVERTTRPSSASSADAAAPSSACSWVAAF